VFPVRAGSVEAEKSQHPLLAYELDRLSRPGVYDEHSPIDPVSADDLEIRQMRAAYYGLIAEVDHHLGRIIGHLKATGEYERTLIIVTSDHAEMLGQHHVWGKEIYFDQAFRLPLVIRDPRADADATRGTTVEAFTEAVDVTPTILDWLGLPVPRSCDGRSLVPLVRGETPPDWRNEVFFEHDFRTVMTQKAETALGITSDECSYAVIRDERYKYVHFAALPPLLFDMVADPHEMNNLADRPDMAATVLEYAQQMLSWRLTHADRTLTNMQLTEDGVVSRP
jgi:arylsulfatase A-like enzyme